MSIPTFKSKEHSNEFCLSFQEKARTYVTFMGIVKELMYGTESGNFSNLPGSCQEVIRDITNSLIYDVEYEFKDAHPEYKNDEDEMFIPRRTFKEDCAEALKEALRQDCPPCDTLTCADHLTDE
jgi:hypothetical protein